MTKEKKFPTLAEAKRHWRTWTWSVLEPEVKKIVEKHGKTWNIDENGQSVMSVPKTNLRFYFSFTNSQIPSIECSTKKD